MLKSRYQLGLLFFPGVQSSLPCSLVVGRIQLLAVVGLVLFFDRWLLHHQMLNGVLKLLMFQISLISALSQEKVLLLRVHVITLDSPR